MLVKANAKINLILNVYDKREDGYHNVEFLMVPIDLYDEIEINLSDEMKINTPGVKLEDNLIYKVYYYSHLYDKDNVFKKVSLTEEKYFSILDDDNGYCTYNKERSYYCGEYIWEKDNNPEIERVVNIFTYLYGLKIFKGRKKLVRSRG